MRSRRGRRQEPGGLLCACLKTQIMHQCSHEATRRAFADAIGKRRMTRSATTAQFGHGKTTHSETEQLVDEYWVLPDAATDLKTGGQANGFEVTAILTNEAKDLATASRVCAFALTRIILNQPCGAIPDVAIPMRKPGE